VSNEPDLRASDADRDAAVERLRAAALDGRLDGDELEERLSQAYAARWCSELARLTDDVTPPLVFVRPERHVNPLAVASLMCGLVWLGFLGSVAAVVMGHMALGQISRSQGVQTGRAAALIGIAFGYFWLTVLLAFVLWRI
jgi:hypothetical protein